MNFITSDGKPASKLSIAYWILGILCCCLGISLSTKAGFGLSMIGAGPYILHVFFRDSLPWFTQGTAEYIWEALILAVLCIIIRRARVRYLFSFLTAVCCGFVIDGWLAVLGGNGVYPSMAARILSFVTGTVVCAFGVACFFRTTLPLQVYELAVAEISSRFGFKTNSVKQGFDAVMLIVCLAMAIGLNHAFTGIGAGTVIVTVVNAPVIAFFGRLLDRFCARLS